MTSIGFGIERLALAVIARPRWTLLLVIALTLAAAVGAAHMRFADDPARLFRSSDETYRTYTAFTQRFADASGSALLIVDGEFRRAGHWQTLSRIVERLKESDTAAGVVSIFTIREMAKAAGPPVRSPFDPLEDNGDSANTVRGSSPLTAAMALARHPLNDGRFLTEDLATATILIGLDPSRPALDAARDLKEAIRRIEATLPPGMSAVLTGLPVVRTKIVDTIISQQPLLLGAGLAIGFLLGFVLLGRVSDAVVISIMPLLSILGIYGVFGGSGLPMTVLLNNLPLLVLALAFANSMHLVYAARRALYSGGYAFTALRATVVHVGPAVVLSTLTTVIAFLSFSFSGSAAITEFGLVGAGAVAGVLVAALVVHPVTVWVALQMGWRPVPPMRGGGRTARVLERGAALLARIIDRLRWPVTLVTIAGTAAAAWAFLEVEPRYSPFDEVRPGSPTRMAIDRQEGDLGGAQTIHLPLPIALGKEEANLSQLSRLERAHESAEAAFPGHSVLSLWTVLRWMGQSGRPLTPTRFERILEATPGNFRHTLLSRDGRTPALVVRLPETAGVARSAAHLEASVGDALDADLSGTASGLAVLAARRGTEIVSRLSLSLAIAALGASLLAALAFRSPRIFFIMLLPNILPVLMVGAVLYAIGAPLQLASALAMTVALGIAVDDTVHVTNAARACLRSKAPRPAIVRTMREVGPVLITTTLVLTLGLGPAFWSWSPAIYVFAAFAITTIAIALLADLISLPALLGISARWVEWSRGLSKPR